MGKVKVIAAIIGVSILSIALAFGITFIVQSSFGNPIGFSLSTPTNLVVSIGRTPSSTSTLPVTTDAPINRNNCTFPIETWLQYPAKWPIDAYPIGNLTFTRDQLIEQITAANGPRELLLAQSIAVVLNQQNGADVTIIRNTFSESIAWLANFPQETIPTEADLRKAENFTQEMEKFNTGQSGIPVCSHLLSQTTPVPLPTRPILLTTSSPTAPTRRPTTLIYPTWTPVPGEKPPASAPTRRPPDPTSPPPPPPTDPPPPPTDPPPPATEVPPEDTPVPPAVEQPPLKNTRQPTKKP